MTTTVLKITVFGGVAPQPIDVILYSDGNQIFRNQFGTSCSIPFDDLPEALYGLFINGRNPVDPSGLPNPNAATICELSTDNISLMPTSDPNPDIEHGIHYLVQYHFTLKV